MNACSHRVVWVLWPPVTTLHCSASTDIACLVHRVVAVAGLAVAGGGERPPAASAAPAAGAAPPRSDETAAAREHCLEGERG